MKNEPIQNDTFRLEMLQYHFVETTRKVDLELGARRFHNPIENRTVIFRTSPETVCMKRGQYIDHDGAKPSHEAFVFWALTRPWGPKEKAQFHLMIQQDQG